SRFFAMCVVAISVSISILLGASVFAQNVTKQNGNLHEKQARVSPEWIQNAIMYQINTRAMTPEGTVGAIREKLPILKKAGVTVIYFCPLFTMDDDMNQDFWSPRQVISKLGNPKNPYRMNDYDKIDSEYGTESDVRAFVEEAHRQGFRVMFDLVYLHCGPKATLVKTHPEYFRHNPDGSLHLTYWKFPEFDFTKMETREYFWQNMEFLVKTFDVDGFRMDVADAIPLDFWEEARRRVDKIKPGCCFFAEGTRVTDQLFAFDMNYGFPFFSTVKNVYDNNAPASTIRKNVEDMCAARPKGARIVHYLDNHDLSNDDFHNRIDKRWTIPGVDAALVMIFTLDGVPMLYCGQEIADMSRHSLYGSQKFGNCIIDWSRLETETGQNRLAFLGKLAEIRKNDPIFTRGTVEWLDNDAPDEILSFYRVLDGRKKLVLINMKPKSVTVKVSGVTAENVEKSCVESAYSRGITANGDAFQVEPFGFMIGK
ncbi:MAG: alpha-amylase family glycosyl hydrolase, partial [Planctomycetia bacterium]|nr:alpha-amylase family glycosyl hydrolase [Planctomycetia bacterium]